MQHTNRRDIARVFVASALSIVLCAMTVWLLALTKPLQVSWDTSLFEGEGTSEQPFIITTAHDLARLRDMANQGDTVAWCHFRQEADIDLSEVEQGAEGWIPIGTASSSYAFHGDYDGAGHIIKNLRCESEDDAALFGDVHGTIRNLGIVSGSVTGGRAAGFACSMNEEGIILNCYNSAHVKGSSLSAGIVCSNTGKVLYCWNNGEILGGTNTTGGIETEPGEKLTQCVSIGVLATPQTFKLGNNKAVTVKTLGDAQNYMSTWHVAFLDYLVKQEFGATSHVLYADDAGLHFGSFADPATGFVWNAFMALAVSHAWLLGLLLVSVVLVVAVLALRRRSKRPRKRNRAHAGAHFADAGDVAPDGEASVVSIRSRLAKGVSVILFVAMLSVSVFCAERILAPSQDEAVSMGGYHHQPKGKVDVLNIGSSRAGWDMDLKTLWDDYGISSYTIWSSAKSMWNTYHDIQDVLRTNPPSVVLLEARSAIYYATYGDYPPECFNLIGQADPLLKLQNVRASARQGSWLDYAFDLPIYHTRFSELVEVGRGIKEPVVYKGVLPLYGRTTTLSEFKTSKDTRAQQKLHPKAHRYLTAIIELLAQRGIPLVIYATPAPDYDVYEPLYNTVQQMAQQYGVPYVDCGNYKGGVTFGPEDLFVDNIHLNTQGSRKVAGIIGPYVRDHYGLQSHHGDATYASWDEYSHEFQNLYLKYLIDARDWFKELQHDDRQLLLLEHWIAKGDYEKLLRVADDVGAGRILPQASDWRGGECRMWLTASTASAQAAPPDALKGRSITFGSHELRYGEAKGARDAKDAAGTTVALMDGDEQLLTLAQPCVVGVVYDPYLDEISDVVAFTGDLSAPQIVRGV